GRERADRDWNLIATARTVDHVGEQEGAALVLRQPALELPARQRMQLGVLVDRPVDTRQQARGFEALQVLLEVARRAGGLALLFVGLWLIEHAPIPRRDRSSASPCRYRCRTGRAAARKCD